MVLPVSRLPQSLLRSKMALAKGLVVRLISVTVRRWRETTSDVRWSALTIVRHVAPAADASLTSRFITFSALSVAIFVAFPGAAAFTVAAVAASAVAVVVVTAAPGLVTVAAARAVAPAATAAMALAVASRWLVTYLGRSTKRL